MRNTIRFAVFGLLIAAGFALAPAASARSHWNVGVNIGLPGLSLGYSDCRHCSHAGAYYGGYYGGGYGYSTYYAPAYYAAPAYSYAPAYYSYPAYSYPAYGSVYYSGRPAYRSYNQGYRGRGGHHRDYDRGRDYGRRAQYYDRGDHHRR